MIHDGALTDSFLVNSGVTQGCLLPPLLFLLSLDWVTKESLAGRRLGIRWTLLTQLEDLDYADDLCLLDLSKTFQQMKHKADRLSITSAKIGLNINTKKTKQMRINPVSQMPLRVNNHKIETVRTFTYLGSVMDEKGRTDTDVLSSRLNKSRAAFASLKPLWRSNVISVKTKLKLFNSNIKTVLLFGSEITSKLRVFIHKCLRIILRIQWPMKVSDKSIRERCNQEDIMVDVARRRWNWIGHVLRRPDNSITKEALYWTPE